jgi:hypothetical protein
LPPALITDIPSVQNVCLSIANAFLNCKGQAGGGGGGGGGTCHHGEGFTILVRRSLGKRLLKRSRSRWEDNITINIRETEEVWTRLN